MTGKKHWYEKEGWAVALLIFFPPVGIYLTWRYTPWPSNVKKIAIGASTLWFLFGLVGSRLDKSREQTITNPAVSTAQQTTPQPTTPISKPASPNPLGVSDGFAPVYKS